MDEHLGKLKLCSAVNEITLTDHYFPDAVHCYLYETLLYSSHLRHGLGFNCN